MSKLDAILYIVSEKVDALPPEKRASLESSLNHLSVGEVVSYMNMQAEMHASGLISTEDALFVYNTIKDWEHASLPARVIVIELMADYAKKKMGKFNKRKTTIKKTTRGRKTQRKREGQPWKIIATTPRFAGGSGGRPFRYVTLEWNRGGRVEYSRHMEVEDGEMYYGHYYQRKEDALADMNRSYKDELPYNKLQNARKTAKKRRK